MLNKKVFILRYCSIYNEYEGGEKEEEGDFGSGWNDIPKMVNHACKERLLFLAIVSDGILAFKTDAVRTEYVFSHTYPISEIYTLRIACLIFSHTILYLIVALEVM